MNMIRPLESHQWFFCTGSHAMQKDLPIDDSDHVRDNTAARWVAEQIITPYCTSDIELTYSGDFIGQIAPNGVLIDEEMHQASLDYVTDILQYCSSTGLLRSMQINQFVDISCIYPGMMGRPDAWVYNLLNNELVIWHLEYGIGEVAAVGNPQLMIYVAGILNHLKISDQQLTVKMKIVQPRSYHSDGPIREWVVKSSDLQGYFNQLINAANTAMIGDSTCSAGTHCRKCHGRFHCTALQKTVYNAIDVITGVIPAELSGNNLSIELQLLRRVDKLLKYRLTAIETQVKSELRTGTALPGYAVKQLYGRKRWKTNTPVDEVIQMGDLMGFDLRKPIALDTPSQALKKGLDESVIKMYSETPPTGFKVIEDDGSKARQAFRKDK